jgi:hypothetical protein
MGHKIHPDTFRLGISKDWQYQLRDPLLANVFIYKTVKKLFFHYSAPYVSYAIRRNVNPRKYISTDHKIGMIQNPFSRNGLHFSHLNISYSPSLLLAIFLLDSKAEDRRIKLNLREKAFYYLSGTFYYRMRRVLSFFRKEMYLPKMTRKNRKAKLWRRYSRFYRRGLGRTVPKAKHLFKKIIKKLKTDYPKIFKTRRIKKYTKLCRLLATSRTPFRYISAWAINNYQIFYRRISSGNIFTNLKILCFLLRYLKYSRYQNYKKRLFFFNILFNSVTSCLHLLSRTHATKKHSNRYKTIFHKLGYLQSILFLQLMRFKAIYLRYNKKLFQSRLILFNLYAKILLFTMRKTAFIPNDRQLIVRFHGLHNRNLSAQFLVNYIISQLSQYIRLNWILTPLVRRFKRLTLVDGFRIIISGRLTRKERAAYIVHSARSMPLSSSNIRIDYAFDFLIMRFGVVGVKVYLLYSKVIPYLYFFEFKNKL